VRIRDIAKVRGNLLFKVRGNYVELNFREGEIATCVSLKRSSDYLSNRLPNTPYGVKEALKLLR
jgi:hypothetical protein